MKKFTIFRINSFPVFCDILTKDFTFHNTSLKISSEVEIIPHLTYGFGLDGSFSYGFIDNLGAGTGMESWRIGYQHDIKLDTVRWERNLRKGFSAQVSNDLYLKQNYDDKALAFNPTINVELSGFLLPLHWLNLSSLL